VILKYIRKIFSRMAVGKSKFQLIEVPLYRINEMRELADLHANFYYSPCLSGNSVPEGFTAGRVNEVALSNFPDLKDWRVFLCGHPDMVNQMKIQSFLKGAATADIYADAFLLSLH
jgi:hypothetical protein